MYDTAINSVAGRLANALLLEMNAKRQQGVALSKVHRQLVRRIASHEGPVGQLGRAVLTRNASFLFSVERDCVIDILGRRIAASDEEGAALRVVMLSYESISPELTEGLGPAVKKGAVESEQSGHEAANVAANVLRSALAEIRGDHSIRWGLTASDVAQILREARPSIRSEALHVLADWLHGDDEAVEERWHRSIGPFFEKVWPKERTYREASLTDGWIRVIVGAGGRFPEALEQLEPYIAPYDRGYGSLHSIASSDVPEKFPRETLKLLWLVCGPNSRGSYYEIAKIIDRLIEADPDMEVDRRLQWLERRAERFD